MRHAFIALFALMSLAADAKETVRIAFIGPLTGGNSAIGLGGRNSADLAVRLRNADAKAKYSYELVVLDDECKPDAGVQMATKAGSDRTIVGGVTNYCSVVAMAAVDTYHRFGLPAIVWGAVLPDITYKNDFKEVHRVNGTMINQNETNAKFMAEHGYRNVAIIHDTTDYGKGHDKYFTQFFTQAGGKIAGDFGVTADQQDFTASSTTTSSRRSGRSPRGRSRSGKARRPRSSRTGRISSSSTTSRGMRSRRKRMGRSHTRPRSC